MKTFDERFLKVYPLIQRLSNKYANSSSVPYEEYESFLCEEFINVDKSFNSNVNNGYVAYVMSMLNSKAKRLADGNRKERRFHDSIQYLDLPDAADDETKYPLELVSDVDIEEQVFDVMFIEEQLAKADGATKDILQLFFAEPHISFREIARRLDLERGFVKRRLEAVAEAVRTT